MIRIMSAAVGDGEMQPGRWGGRTTQRKWPVQLMHDMFGLDPDHQRARCCAWTALSTLRNLAYGHAKLSLICGRTAEVSVNVNCTFVT